MEKIREFHLTFQVLEFCWRSHANSSLLRTSAMRDTNLEDVTETKILEWKSVVQELV